MSSSLVDKYKEIFESLETSSILDDVQAEQQEDQLPLDGPNLEIAPAETKAHKALPLELKHVVQFPDYRGVTRVVGMEAYEGRQRYKERDKAYKDFPILYRHKYDKKGELVKVQLEIQSPLLRDLFKEIAANHRALNLTAKPIAIPRPYRPLFFLRKELAKRRKSERTPQRTKQEIGLLLEFIESEDGLKDIIKAHTEMVLDTDAPGKISFELLWTLFPPHELVYVNLDGSESCFMIEYTEAGKLEDGTDKLACHVYSGWHNGTRFGIVKEVMSLPSFPGVVDIDPQNLPIVPLERLSHLHQLQIRQRLFQRGQRYVELQSTKFSHLLLEAGLINFTNSKEVNRVPMAMGDKYMSMQAETRVLVDAQTYRKIREPYLDFVAFNAKQITEGKVQERGDSMASSFSTLSHRRGPPQPPRALYRPPPPISQGFGSREQAQRPPPIERPELMKLPEWLRDDTRSRLSDLDYLICPSRIYAFVLDKKIWAQVQVSLLREISWTENAFDYLELEKGKKSLVQGLVEGFDADEEFGGFDDIVQGKGKGLIFLLHGDPGLGKTMTAETIAEHTRRPLYHLTAGELSTNVMIMEGQLRQIFGLGTRWGAVVLLDEADVLMSKRTLKELDRSAIVAVFLRTIEYYQGLLFLTTNRLEEFDPAFHNRIHVTIKYNDLSPKSRSQIWRNLLAKSQSAISLDSSWSNDVFLALSEWKSNGRDIRNLIRTAYGFAKSEKADLGLEHVVMVLENILSERDRREAGGVIGRLKMLADAAMLIDEGVMADANDTAS